MTDLTNKILELKVVDADALLKKYTTILESINPEERLTHAYVFDYAISIINTHYAVINKIWRAWIILVVKNLIPTFYSDYDIEKCINEFLIFHNNNYQNYLNETISHDEIDRDMGFVNMFIKTKKTVTVE